MLDAAVPGAVFTSPTPDQIAPAIAAADGGAGVLTIVKNYTGDVLNFETAAELADADGITVRQVVVNDDVAVEDSLYTAGRRGVAGTVAVEKIAGAAAERGDDLDAVAAVAPGSSRTSARWASRSRPARCRTSGVPASTSATTRSRSASASTASPAGTAWGWSPRTRSPRSCSTPVVEDLGPRRRRQVLLFVNGMGGTPASELYVVYRRARALLAERGVAVDPLARRQLRDIAGDAGRVGHGPPAGRRADRAVGRARAHAALRW